MHRYRFSRRDGKRLICLGAVSISHKDFSANMLTALLRIELEKLARIRIEMPLWEQRRHDIYQLKEISE